MTNKYLKKIGNGFKALGYYFWNDKIALITGLTTGLSAAAYRIVVGISVAGHDEIGIDPFGGEPVMAGTHEGNFFSNWFWPGFNTDGYVHGDAANFLTTHDAIIYNTCAGFSGVMIGIGFSLAVFLAVFLTINGIRNIYRTINPRILKEHEEKS